MTPRDDITVLCVPPEQFGRVLAACHDTLTRGLRLCDVECMGDVVERIEDANLQVWIVADGRTVLATCYTDINVNPDGSRWVGVYGLAGERIMRWARQLSDTLAAFARDEGCARVMFKGRPGWARVLPEFRRTERRGDEYVWERMVLS